MATHSDIGVSQPAASTTTMKVGTVVLTRNSSAQHQELLTLADPETTNALQRILASSNADSTMFGAVVRQPPPQLTNSASTQGSGSTRSTVVSSNANTFGRVTAYSVMSTVTGTVIRGGFYSGSVLVWPVMVWPDGGAVKDQLAVGYPGYIFAGSTGIPITWNQDSTGDVTVAITYYTGAP